MARRRRIGLLAKFDESWTGGVYYLFNIVQCCKALPQSEQPEIVVFYKDEKTIEQFKQLEYPFISFLPLRKYVSFFHRALNKLSVLLLKRRINSFWQYSREVADFVFPCVTEEDVTLDSLVNLRCIFWIPDFQHKYLPHLFSEAEVHNRDRTCAQIASSASTLVLSSDDCKEDFFKFYPKAEVKVNVIRFASVFPRIDLSDIESVLFKYGVRNKFFISPNQFWAHKNHKIVIDAVKILLEEGVTPYVLFTGKENDYRNPGYLEGLKKMVHDHELSENIKFLGFIDRIDQLKLMKSSLAVIQPSLFEGWSTVVEDAKALGCSLIVSNLSVHKEQCQNSATYFDPKDPKQLANGMRSYLAGNSKSFEGNYAANIAQFAHSICNL